MKPLSPTIRVLLIGLMLLVSGGCGTLRPEPAPPLEEVIGEPPDLVQVAMWAPNRILDALDTIRFGVGVGPGMGVDVRITRLAQISAMSGLPFGVGWQGRWNSPVLSDSRAFLAAGPITLGSTSLNKVLSWQRTDWEIRVEAHAGLVLAQAAVDLYQIYDLVVGILFYDPGEDDILGPHWY